MNSFDNFLKSYLQSQDVKTISIENGINLFINDLSKCRRPATISYYKDHLKPFLDYSKVRNIIYFNEIDNKFIQAYIQKLKFMNNENQTINKRVSLIRMVINYLLVNNYISKLDLIYPKLEVKQKEIKVITDNEVVKLLNYAYCENDLKHRLIVLLLISTGIRRNELVNIKVCNIDFFKKRIYLDYTKSKKTRYIFVDDSICELIKKVCFSNKQKIYLFENSLGFQMSSAYITQLMYSIKNKLGIEKLSPHKLRHTYATYLLKNGANQEEVRRLLGHSDFKMTKRYIDYLDNDLQIANTLYNPLNLLKNKS